jgi:hypothetical protein
MEPTSECTAFPLWSVLIRKKRTKGTGEVIIPENEWRMENVCWETAVGLWNVQCWMKCINCFLKMGLNIEICLLLLTNKCAIFDVNTFLLRIAHLSMSKHHHHNHYQRVVGYTKVSVSIEASSTVTFRCHNTVKRLKYHIVIKQASYNS